LPSGTYTAVQITDTQQASDIALFIASAAEISHLWCSIYEHNNDPIEVTKYKELFNNGGMCDVM
jgi:hypothetical protein